MREPSSKLQGGNPASILAWGVPGPNVEAEQGFQLVRGDTPESER